MAKVNQNKLIGGLVVAVITLLVVIIIVVVAKELFPANSKNSSSTLLGTDTNPLQTAAPVTTTTAATTPETTSADVTTTPQQTTGDEPAVTNDPTAPDLTGQTIYLNTSVYLRSSASWGGDKGEVVAKGESAKVVRVEGDWYVLDYNGSQGYVYKEYISQQPAA